MKGKWNGGAIPLGYKVVDHKLVVDEETVPIVSLAFQLCADGKTAKEVYNYFKEKHICRPNGRLIAYNSVLYLLANRVYIGEYNHLGVVLKAHRHVCRAHLCV